MIKTKKQMYLVIFSFALVMLLGTVTYAFFNYTRTGSSNVIKVGRIYFNTNQSDTINLTNLFPIDPEETGIMNDSTKVGTLEIEIEGDTDYSDGIEYLITTTNAHVNTNEGRIVPISIDVTVDSLGTPNDNYFTARNSKNATIYKRLSGNSVVGNQQILVGYIKPNTTSGTAEGIDGSITIKAYLDKNKILISDTYDGTESDNMGTTNNWVDDRVVITTNEWNALQSTGVSFQVKVEANEGIWVDEPIYNVMRMNAVMDNIQSTNVSSSTGIDFSKISGDTDSDNVLDNGEGLYVRAGTENDAYPIVYYRGDVDNNVYFAGKCWQIVRTTETGGTKLIYNGENTGSSSKPACENTGVSTVISLDMEGTPSTTFMFNENIDSLAYNGYMYGTVYSMTNADYEEGSKFGNGVIWDGTNYTLTNVSDSIDANHHYTCGTANTTTCSSIRYYFTYFIYANNNNRNYYIYFTLANGKSIEDAIIEMQYNDNDSNAKSRLDMWYMDNMTNYTNKIEDTVYCNDRSIFSLDGLNPNGGKLVPTNLSYFLAVTFMADGIRINKPSLKCNQNDAFTVSNEIGNGELAYPVSLLSIDEVVLAGGGISTSNSAFYLKNGVNYWSLTPDVFTSEGGARYYRIASSGSVISVYSNKKAALRPVISLKLGTSIADGDGTAASPYIIK